MTAMFINIIPEFRHDQAVQRLMVASTSSNLSAVVDKLMLGVSLEDISVPPTAVEYARRPPSTICRVRKAEELLGRPVTGGTTRHRSCVARLRPTRGNDQGCGTSDHSTTASSSKLRAQLTSTRAKLGLLATRARR